MTIRCLVMTKAFWMKQLGPRDVATGWCGGVTPQFSKLEKIQVKLGQ